MGRAGGALGGGYGYGDNSLDAKTSEGARTYAVRGPARHPMSQTRRPGRRLYQIAISSGFARTPYQSGASVFVHRAATGQPAHMLMNFATCCASTSTSWAPTFLRLAELRLNTHPVFCRPVDPSLYIHRFATSTQNPNMGRGSLTPPRSSSPR
jgi:hypothetical protein